MSATSPAGFGERVDQEPRRMGFSFAKNAPSEHRRLEHGDLQPRELRLHAVREDRAFSKMKSNSIATISIVIDSSWFRPPAERRFLQVGRIVVHASGIPANATCAPPTSKSLCRLKPRQSFVQIDRR